MKNYHSPAKISLCRYGGLGKHIKQKGNYSSKDAIEDEMSFHQAPERRGYYAFIFPYVELFLLGSPVNPSSKNGEYLGNNRGRFLEKEKGQYKKFEATGGTIWIHLKPKNESMILEKKGSWYKINVSDFSSILKKHIALLKKQNSQWLLKEDASRESTIGLNPFYWISKDEMEVFITKDTKINS